MKLLATNKKILSTTIMFRGIFNPLPDDKILDWSKLEQIAEKILKFI